MVTLLSYMVNPITKKQATFHSTSNASSIVIKNMDEAVELGKYISWRKTLPNLNMSLAIGFPKALKPEIDLQKLV